MGQILFQKLSCKRPLLKFFLLYHDHCFGHNFEVMLLLSVSGKRLLGMIMYDCKEIITQLSKKC